MTWFFFAFMTALFEALKDVTSKKTIAATNEYIVSWAWVSFPLPFLVVALWVQGIPPIAPPFWVALFFGVLIVFSSFTLYMKAIKASDLSVTLPMIAFTPIFLLVTSPLIVGEFPRPLGLFGILFIFAGSYVLNLKEKHKGIWEPYRALLREKGPKLMLLVAFIWSIGANVDKVGVSNSSGLFWLVMVYSCASLLMTPLMLRHTADLRKIPRNLPKLALIGLFMAFSSMSQMTAIMLTLVPYVISVKRISIVLGVLLGHILFHEPGFRDRMLGVIIMLVGVVGIALS